MLLLQVGKLRQEACVSCSPAWLRLGADPQALLCLAALLGLTAQLALPDAIQQIWPFRYIAGSEILLA